MKAAMLRAFALAVLLGQFVQVSGGMLCGRAHNQHDACEGSMPASGSSVRAATQVADAGPCSLLGPCGAPATAPVTPILLVDASFQPAGPASAVTPIPVSFSSAPIPPPPQA